MGGLELGRVDQAVAAPWPRERVRIGSPGSGMGSMPDRTSGDYAERPGGS